MIKIVYIGILSAKVRGIEDLCDAVVSINNEYPGAISVDFYGFGPLEKKLTDFSCTYSCIKFLGKLESGRQQEIYSEYDMMAAFYYTHNCRVHKYAAPNKFFDHLSYGIPILTNHGHSFANEICKLGSGLVTEENMHSIKSALLENFEALSINKEELKSVLQNYQKESYKAYCTVLK